MHLRHKWAETERFKTPPLNSLQTEKVVGDPRYIERLVYGVTTILFRCEKCSAIKTIEILGRK